MKLNNQGWAIATMLITFIVFPLALAVTGHVTGKTSIRQLFNAPCENSEFATTGSGSYVCTK